MRRENGFHLLAGRVLAIAPGLGCQPSVERADASPERRIELAVLEDKIRGGWAA
jgi:hypothetical protein